MGWPLLLIQSEPTSLNWGMILQGGAFTAVVGAIAAVFGTLIKRSQALGTTNIGDLAKFRAELIAKGERQDHDADVSEKRLIRATKMVAVLSGDLVMLIGFIENATECLKTEPPNTASAARILQTMLGKLAGITARVDREIAALTDDAAQDRDKADAAKAEPTKVSVEVSQKKPEE